MLNGVDADEFFEIMTELLSGSSPLSGTWNFALEPKQQLDGVVCLEHAGSEDCLTVGLRFSVVLVEAGPAKIPTPDLMEELHLTPDSIRESNCDFTVQEFNF